MLDSIFLFSVCIELIGNSRPMVAYKLIWFIFNPTLPNFVVVLQCVYDLIYKIHNKSCWYKRFCGWGKHWKYDSFAFKIELHESFFAFYFDKKLWLPGFYLWFANTLILLNFTKLFCKVLFECYKHCFKYKTTKSNLWFFPIKIIIKCKFAYIYQG